MTHFWQTKSLAEMDEQEWDSLCDRCGRCCLSKLEDEDTGEILYTQVACRLLDIEHCRCTHYQQRQELVPECMNLRHDFRHYHWLPTTCAYRLLYEGKPLFDWHPLLSGNPESVHDAGISVRDLAISENDVEGVEDYVMEGFG
ncbi:MAG: YcgN family cysteine cluster protein [Methylococcaceae bacterium]|jgi:uncharacterized cysteine cluster protein YcgN (CxxCxxCC family)